jgi:hypothetical protein
MEYTKLKIDRSHKNNNLISRCHDQRKTSTLKNLTKSYKILETRSLFLTSRQIPLRREQETKTLRERERAKKAQKKESEQIKPNVN